jgi:hypothetical protein
VGSSICAAITPADALRLHVVVTGCRPSGTLRDGDEWDDDEEGLDANGGGPGDEDEAAAVAAGRPFWSMASRVEPSVNPMAIMADPVSGDSLNCVDFGVWEESSSLAHTQSMAGQLEKLCCERPVLNAALKPPAQLGGEPYSTCFPELVDRNTSAMPSVAVQPAQRHTTFHAGVCRVL